MMFLLLLACAGDPEPAETPPVPTPAVAAPVTPPVPEGPRVPPQSATRFAAHHILVAWQGAVNALPTIARDRAEAQARAEEARAKIVAGADFEEVAKAYSDDSTGARGGNLGGFETGVMVQPFEAAVKLLQLGEISPLVETPFGFHIIRRDALVEVRCAHLIVSWASAERAPTGVTRTREEARARADAALAAAREGMAWNEVVRTYSDGPMKEDGGDLGWFARRQLAPALDTAAFDLDIGATSEVIESPRGFHLLKRLE